MLTKFLIIPEKEESNFFHLLPLIESLRQDYPECEVNVIHSINLEYQFKGMYPSIKFFQIEESQLGPVSSLKLAEQMFEIFNLDFLLNYRSDVGALHLGKAFKAKKRIGLKHIVNDLFLTDSFKSEIASGPLRYIGLWERFLNKDKDLGPIGFEKEISPENFFKAKEVEPFVFFPFVLNEENASIINLLVKLLNEITEIRKIYWFQEENSFTEEFKKAPLENTVDASSAKPEDLFNYILHCQGILTNLQWVSSLSSFMQVESILIKNPKDLLPDTSFFKLSPTGVDFLGEGRFELILGDEKKPLDEGAFIEEIFNWFRL
ncbi:MAG: hypothetical protein NXH75_08160 [Halobacteriovoraceae bacterium]|nr:hypothetical protein [Halobacteriovoraceae bacterium]